MRPLWVYGQGHTFIVKEVLDHITAPLHEQFLTFNIRIYIMLNIYNNYFFKDSHYIVYVTNDTLTVQIKALYLVFVSMSLFNL